MSRLEQLQSFAVRAAKRLADVNRTVVVLKVDLTDANHHLRPRDRSSEAFRLLPFDRQTLPRVLEMVERYEPWRKKSVLQRFREGRSGFVAEHEGEVAGYVFWAEGAHHSDLRWLNVRPSEHEIFAFDYYLIESARGLGNEFVRRVQGAHHRMGYTAAYGCVFPGNKAALWLYRTTGWREIHRVTEHRLLSRFALVGHTLYWMHPYSRSPILSLKRLTVGHRDRS